MLPGIRPVAGTVLLPEPIKPRADTHTSRQDSVPICLRNYTLTTRHANTPTARTQLGRALLPRIRPRYWHYTATQTTYCLHRTATKQTRTRADMHASNSLTLPPLLNLFVNFFKRGARGAFLWLRARYNKRGGIVLGGTRVLEEER